MIFFSIAILICPFAIRPRWCPISMYLVLPVFTAKLICLQTFNNTSVFLFIVLISLPIKFTSSAFKSIWDWKKKWTIHIKAPKFLLTVIGKLLDQTIQKIHCMLQEDGEKKGNAVLVLGLGSWNFMLKMLQSLPHWSQLLSDILVFFILLFENSMHNN